MHDLVASSITGMYEYYYTPGRGKIVLCNYTPGRGEIVRAVLTTKVEECAQAMAADGETKVLVSPTPR